MLKFQFWIYPISILDFIESKLNKLIIHKFTKILIIISFTNINLVIITSCLWSSIVTMTETLRFRNTIRRVGRRHDGGVHQTLGGGVPLLARCLSTWNVINTDDKNTMNKIWTDTMNIRTRWISNNTSHIDFCFLIQIWLLNKENILNRRIRPVTVYIKTSFS